MYANNANPSAWNAIKIKNVYDVLLHNLYKLMENHVILTVKAINL